MNKVRGILIMLLSLALLLALSTLSGCADYKTKDYRHIDDYGGDQYETFVAQENIPHFNFEYSSFYHVEGYYTSSRYPGVSINILGPEEDQVVQKVIRIDSYDYASDAKREMKNSITDYQKAVFSGHFKNLKIQELSTVMILGTRGYESVAFYTLASVPWEAYPDFVAQTEPLKMVVLDLHFFYQNLMWNINLTSDAASFKQVKADFEHIARTLTFLE